ELISVAAILVIVAGFLVSNLTRHSASAKDTSTRASLAAIREAIVGTPEKPGYLADTGQLPATLADLFSNPFPPSNPLSAFNRETGLGWRGPYLIAIGGRYVVNPSAGFIAAYGTAGDPAVLDAWGNTLVIQRGTSGTPAQNESFARLISAGPDGIL